MKLRSKVVNDAITQEVSESFDYAFSGETEVEVPDLPALPGQYGVGLIVGPSGSGKTTLLKTLGGSSVVKWDGTRSVASHFTSAADARERLSAAGLNSIPSWCRPFHALSTGEQFRADVARRLDPGACIDEFTSVVDRNVAKSCSVAVARYVKKQKLFKLTLATCHYDVVPWLQPDWVYDTATGVLTPRGSLPSTPAIELDLFPCTVNAWTVFLTHHYLSGEINAASRCWVAIWGDILVGFVSVLAFPNGNFKNAWREHRTVVLPDFQGMGIGVRISDAVGALLRAEGKRYFSKTAHPRMGAYRDASLLWRPTSKNRKARPDYAAERKTKESAYKHKHIHRVTWSHEYVGPAC